MLFDLLFSESEAVLGGDLLAETSDYLDSFLVELLIQQKRAQFEINLVLGFVEILCLLHEIDDPIYHFHVRPYLLHQCV